MEHIPAPGGSAFSPRRVVRRLIRTTRFVGLQHGFKTRARGRTWLFDGQKREFSPNDHFFSTVRALFEVRSEEHTSELQSRSDLVCRLLLEKKNKTIHSS